MSFLLVWLVFRSMILGVLAGAVWWLIRGRTNRLQSGPVASLTAVGVSVALLADVLVRLMVGGTSALQLPRPDELALWLVDARFVLPLLFGISAVIILAFPLPTHASRGSASLARRTPFSYGREWWFIAVIIIVSALLIVTAAAGMASQPDEQGLWRILVVDTGVGGGSTTIYGWYYSQPALALVAVLLAVTVGTLWQIARPALGMDQVNDVLLRGLRTRNIVAVASGALLIHLGGILSSLAGTAFFNGGVATGNGGWVVFGTPFAALEPALSLAGVAVTALGYALWVGVLLSAIPARRAVRALVRA
jgi:hypothetical protein